MSDEDRRWALRYSVYRWVRYELVADGEGWLVVGFVTGRNDIPETPGWWVPFAALDTRVVN
jgi:predicted type IV restriction endonuclease